FPVAVAVDLRPGQTLGLVTTCGSQQQKPDQCVERVRCLCCHPQGAQLVVAQGARPCALASVIAAHSGNDRRVEVVNAAGVPVEGTTQVGQREIGCAVALLVLDLVEQSDDLRASQGAQGHVANLRQDQPLECPPARLEATQLSALALEVQLTQPAHGLGVG